MTDSRVMVWMQMSLDGYASGPDGAFDWPSVGPDLQSTFIERARDVGTFAYGRHVFEMMASYWPTAGDQPDAEELDRRFGEIWVPKPKVVFSRTLESADWNATVARGDLASEVAAAKERSDGDIALFGGPTIVHALLGAGLIDELRLFVHPVVLGGGAPLFPAGLDRLPLRLLESNVYDGTVTHLQYATA